MGHQRWQPLFECGSNRERSRAYSYPCASPRLSNCLCQSNTWLDTASRCCKPTHLGAELGRTVSGITLQLRREGIEWFLACQRCTPRRDVHTTTASASGKNRSPPHLDLRPGRRPAKPGSPSGAIDLARAQVTDQQLVAAKDIRGTVVIVVTMKETAFLFAMDGIIGGPGSACSFEFELLNDHLVHAPRPRGRPDPSDTGSNCWPVPRCAPVPFGWLQA